MVTVSIDWLPKRKKNHAFGAFPNTDMAFIEICSFVKAHNLKDYTLVFRNVEFSSYEND